MVRRCWVNFQCWGVLPIRIIVGQGPVVLAVGAGGGCLDIFSLISYFSFLSPSLWETAQYRLKYCLEGPLSLKQPTNQLPERGRKRRERTEDSKNVQTNLTRTYCKRKKPCPTIIQIVGRPGTGSLPWTIAPPPKQNDNLCPVQDHGSLAVFNVTARDQGQYKGPSGAFDKIL